MSSGTPNRGTIAIVALLVVAWPLAGGVVVADGDYNELVVVVEDENSEPIEEAGVEKDDPRKYIPTDENGEVYFYVNDGEHTFEISKTGFETKSVTVSVTSDEQVSVTLTDPDDDGSDRSWGGSGSDEDEEEDTFEPPESLTVDAEQIKSNASTAEVADAGDGTAVELTFPTTTTANETGVTVSGLSFDAVDRLDANVTLTTSAEPSESATALPTETEEFVYWTLEYPNGTNDAVENVTTELRVDADRLDADDRPAEELRVYRLHDGNWSSLDATVVNQTDDEYVYEVSSPGLSEFAVTYADPSFEVQHASIDEGEYEVGESTSVTALVENDGNGSDAFTAELTVGDRVVDQQTVWVPAGETRTVSFDHQFTEPGTHDVVVDETVAGSVTVPWPTHLLTVTAVNEDGEPVPNATVQIRGITATTDDDGSTTVELTENEHDGVVSADGFEDEEFMAVVVSDTELEIPLEENVTAEPTTTDDASDSESERGDDAQSALPISAVPIGALVAVVALLTLGYRLWAR